jgi:Terpene cyclase DEP1
MSHDILPILAAIFIVSSAIFLRYADLSIGKLPWGVPASVSLLFLLYSIYAIFSEGPLGFWTEHTRNAWGNQIWFDLLLGILVAWYFMLPRAKALKMRLNWWLFLIVCTGCIGVTSMFARLLYLNERMK